MSLISEADEDIADARHILEAPETCVQFPQSPRGFLCYSQGALVGDLDRR